MLIIFPVGGKEYGVFTPGFRITSSFLCGEREPARSGW